MRAELTRVRPNPFRDFKIDPIDPEAEEAVLASIEQDGFWSGVTGRKNKAGEIELAAGHTRLAAAIRAGVTHAEIYIGDYDDQAMIRIYARENTTQRGGIGLALTGIIASSFRYLIKSILLGNTVGLEKANDDQSAFDWDKVRRSIGSEAGLGYAVIEAFLAGVPGVNKLMITRQLANLKASGDYARIVKEVNAEVDQEQAQARAELKRREEAAERDRQEAEAAMVRRREAEEKAKKARDAAQKKAAEGERQQAAEREEKAKKKHKESAAAVETMGSVKTARDTGRKAQQTNSARKETFDLGGVSKYLKGEVQLRVFREVVERPSMQKYLPLNAQAILAKSIVEEAKRTGDELSGAFIRAHMTALMLEASGIKGRLDKAAREQLEKEDVHYQLGNLQHHFARNVQGVHLDGLKILEFLKDHRDTKFEFLGEFLKAVDLAESIVVKLATALRTNKKDESKKALKEA